MTIFSPNMLVSVCIGIFLLMWFHVFSWLTYNLSIGSLTFKEMGSTYLDDIYSAYARGGYQLFAPILAVLPAATLFCEDYNSGYIKSILNRVEKNRYIDETLVCSSISGGLAVFFPCLISYAFYIIYGQANTVDNAQDGYSTVFDETAFAGIQYIWGGLLFVILLLILAFMFGAIWSNIGLCVSTLIPNRYVALAVPFAIYFSCHLVFYRLGSLLMFSPTNMLMPAATFIPSPQYPFVYQLALFIIVAFFVEWLMKRRLRNV